MNCELKYKDLIGSIHFSSVDEVYYGKIEGINDLITFESKNLEGLELSFKEAVEDYITLLKQIREVNN